jgi:Transposase and inactivated derivatives
LFIADGIPKLDEEIRKVFPRADFQLCTIHASRNFESEIREYDVEIIDSQLKQIFLSEDREEASKGFNEFKNIWQGKYPKQVYNLERKLNYLFTYIHIFPLH